MGLFTKIKTASHITTTYRVGLLQTKAYRILKQHTSTILMDSGFSTVDWALIGLLYDHKEGMRLSALAYELGVEAPFVTQMFNRLKQSDYIIQEPDKNDSRAKIACLNEKGRLFVDTTERVLRDKTKPLFKGVSIGEILSFLHVMNVVVESYQSKSDV